VEYAYRADGWQPFYSVVGTAAAALAGLLFIAMSLNLRAVVTHAPLLARAREAFGGFFNLLMLTLLILIPGQDRHVLGAELVTFGIVLAALSVVLQGETIRRLSADRRARWALRNLPLNLATVTILVAGAGLLFGTLGGLFWLVPTVLVYFLWASLNAWNLIVQSVEA